LKFEKSRQKYSMIYYFTAHKNGKLKKIHGLEKIKQLEFVNTVRLNVSLGDSVRIPENSDDRLGYITFYSDSYNSLIKNKKAIEETLKIEIL
ncbi:TPA: phosphoribosylamine--glycine ligase, partial [Staphylococcus aureus]|nr:phosphoribosylamine--glycine ligase [Staphylococcus aureus]HDF8042926.1 phosphoribosylamine--glycine ligase [Staphylococcus aureus]HDF8670522.1 phosphoribosylamine--glycine ligase [Staphylococcus aureus]HDF8914494.1 phosphoribosylamine--glycine ligase [Staphylococcus aureus]HDF9282771.1 phosphoribosylamine--glycine ligase [Staphylococcus aureus]